MKYIMMESMTGVMHPILFPESFVHIEMARHMTVFMRRGGDLAEPVRAGFVELGLNTRVYGKSESLGLESNATDAIRMILGSNGNAIPEELLMPILQRMKARAQE